MVAQDSSNSLKNRPKDERVAVASASAIGVVIVLLIGWGIYFFNKIQSGAIHPTLQSSSAQDQFNSETVREAQQQFKDQYKNVSNELQDLRNEALLQQSGGAQMQLQQQTNTGSQFGNTGTSE